MWLTALLLMPSATAMAMPLEPSCGSLGIATPWKSWFEALRPLSEYCPTETFMARSGVAFGGRADVGRVQGQAGEGQAAHQVAKHGRDLVPDDVVHDREGAAQHQAGWEQEHVDD